MGRLDQEVRERFTALINQRGAEALGSSDFQVLVEEMSAIDKANLSRYEIEVDCDHSVYRCNSWL